MRAPTTTTACHSKAGREARQGRPPPLIPLGCLHEVTSPCLPRLPGNVWGRSHVSISVEGEISLCSDVFRVMMVEEYVSRHCLGEGSSIYIYIEEGSLKWKGRGEILGETVKYEYIILILYRRSRERKSNLVGKGTSSSLPKEKHHSFNKNALYTLHFYAHRALAAAFQARAPFYICSRARA